MKKRHCRYCHGPKHGDFASMCEGSLGALLDGFAKLRERIARRRP